MSTPSKTDTADAAWVDPAWPVDSTTRQCCNGIGAQTAELAAVPAPADAHHVEDWRDDFGTGEYDRYFRGTRRSAAGVTLAVTGFQAADGTARRDVRIFASDVHLDQTALRDVGRACPGRRGRTRPARPDRLLTHRLERPAPRRHTTPAGCSSLLQSPT